jgi:hypothetical protein
MGVETMRRGEVIRGGGCDRYVNLDRVGGDCQPGVLILPVMVVLLYPWSIVCGWYTIS